MVKRAGGVRAGLGRHPGVLVAGAVTAAAGAGIVALNWRSVGKADTLRHDGRGGEVLSVTTSDGVELHVEADGPADAPLTVVFIHGWTLSLTTWRHQRATLEDSGVRRIFYDLRGHGMSGRGTEGPGSVRQLAEDLHTVLEQVAPHGPVVLVGHSMGCMIILALAGLHPKLFGARVTAALMLAPAAGELDTATLGLPEQVAQWVHGPGLRAAMTFGRYPGLIRAGGMLPYLTIARRLTCDPGASQETVRACAALISGTRLDVLGEYGIAMQQYDEYAALDVLSGIRTVLVAGVSDKLIPLHFSERVAEGIPGTQLITLPGCGHMIPLEQPVIVDKYLAEMIAGSLAPADPQVSAPGDAGELGGAGESRGPGAQSGAGAAGAA